MTADLLLLPVPRRLTRQAGGFRLTADRLIRITAPDPQRIFSMARRFQAALQCAYGWHWQIVAGFAVPGAPVGLELRLAPGELPHPQGYRLVVAEHGLRLTAPDEAGLFYGVTTLIQLLEQRFVAPVGGQRFVAPEEGQRFVAPVGGQAEEAVLPALEIVDWPDFPARGVMLDVSRDKVPTLETLFDLVDRLASWKINQLQLYTEHTFAYQNHPEVWAKASPLTGEDILALDAYCRERFIELVPNQNSFGHMGRWLKYPRYAGLAEIHGEFKVPWGVAHGPFSLAPVQPGSIDLVRGLYDELLPHFSSRMFNVGCDETFDLGSGQSQALCAERGVGRVYLDFLLQIYAEVSRRGLTMQFWGDIINDHPQLVPELPRDAIGLLWGYEADHPFDVQGARFAAAGVPFYVCPGTSSWNTLAGRTENALGNLLNAAENGLKHGACGYLNTDWGDNGHWQAYPVAFLGYAAGAAYSWCLAENRALDMAAAVGRFAFDDPTGRMGRLAFDLGNAYRAGGVLLMNTNIFNAALARSLNRLAEQKMPVQVGAAREELEAAMENLAGEGMTRPDAPWVRREYALTGRLMRHALRRIELAQAELAPQASAKLRGELAADLAEWLPEYRTLWLARNRPGGLEDSTRRFEEMALEYRAENLNGTTGSKDQGHPHELF